MKLRTGLLILLSAFVVQSFAWADAERYALIIGNSNYQNDQLDLGTPVNDANDVADALSELGYNVALKENVSKQEFTTALADYVEKLQAAGKQSEGFFWYGGHGTEIDGQNYLWPVDVAITSAIAIRESSWSLQQLLAYLGEAGNKMNVVVIDACRDSLPQALPQTVKTRGAIRGGGFSKVDTAEKDVFVMMSTAAGQSALDGDAGARNSPFATAFLKHIDAPEPLQLMVTDVINETVSMTGNRQRPYTNGSVSDKYYSINPNVQDSFSPPPPLPKPPAAAAAPVINNSPAPKPDQGFIFIKGGSFMMGTPADEWRRESDETQHSVTVGDFYMQAHELTQAEYQAIMGVNPSKFKGANLPVEHVTWYDAIEYCNRRSAQEGLTPAYSIDKVQIDPNNLCNEETDNIKWSVTQNLSAPGYRLPTEAEWEYACRAGIIGPFDKGNRLTTNDANFDGNYPWTPGRKTERDISGKWLKKTMPVGSYEKNRWGLFEMHGNVSEWCWDWAGTYSTAPQTDPQGAVSGGGRIIRGGSWYDSARRLRSGARRSYQPTFHNNAIGFRLVRGIN
jgi:formylglycine-generating enzyme required for sulfatase activity